MALRKSIQMFNLANNAYVGASVTFYTVDSGGVKTTTKATLYDAITGTGTLANPQTLDSDGKLAQAVYIDTEVVGSVSGLSVTDHDTGIIAPFWNARGAWATATAYNINDVVYITSTEDSAADGNLYICGARHTSGTFTTDRDTNSYWILFLDAQKARLWASEAEDVLVDATKYSSLHYSLKAAASAAAAAISAAAASGLYKKVTGLTTGATNVEIANDGTYYVCDVSGGDVTINLPAIGTDEGTRFGFQKVGASNTVTFVRDGTDTINGGTSYSISEDTEVVIFIADDNSPDNWIASIQSQTVAGNGLSKTGSTIALKPVVVAAIALGGEAAALAVGTGTVTFHAAVAFTLTDVVAGLATAQTSGAILTFDVNEAGVSILSTKLTIDNTEDTSVTAATSAVLSDTAIAAGAKITVDVDQIGDGTAKGGKLYLIGYPA